MFNVVYSSLIYIYRISNIKLSHSQPFTSPEYNFTKLFQPIIHDVHPINIVEEGIERMNT